MTEESNQKSTPNAKTKQNGTPTSNANDGQFAFLIACIRHSDNGKVRGGSWIQAQTSSLTDTQVDFTKVAEECSIVSKGAA